MSRSLHHISYTVSDLDRSIPFYRDVLQFRFLHDVERANLSSYDTILGYTGIRVRIAAFELPGTHVILELMQFRNPLPRAREQEFVYVATSHLAYVVDDIEREYDRIKSGGGRFLSSVSKIHRDGRYIGKAVFFFDPDGILFEPMQLA